MNTSALEPGVWERRAGSGQPAQVGEDALEGGAQGLGIELGDRVTRRLVEILERHHQDGQELLQMPRDRLLVLHAGLPPIRGRKIVYWRERMFTARLQPPPAVPARQHPRAPTSVSGSAAAAIAPAPAGAVDDQDLTLALPDLDVAAFGPLPSEGATVEEVEAWVDRFIDASVHLPKGQGEPNRCGKGQQLHDGLPKITNAHACHCHAPV